MTQHTFWQASDGANAVAQPINATLELGAYESLWCDTGATYKTIAEKLAALPGSRPSAFVPEEEALETGVRVIRNLRDRLRSWFDVRIHGESEYPIRLRDAAHPVELLYIQGLWELTSMRSVAVVGTRTPSDDGIARAKALVRKLVADKFVIVSGLAEGVDTVAHKTAIAEGGFTIGVIGTPLGHVYPRKNESLQEEVARNHLLISQVPVERYSAQRNVRLNSWFFPERNKTMSALTEATIIVEAGETSGTLVQARAALNQGRKLFILNSCFERTDITWPARFLDEGAIRVRDYDDIRRELVQQPS